MKPLMSPKPRLLESPARCRVLFLAPAHAVPSANTLASALWFSLAGCTGSSGGNAKESEPAPPRLQCGPSRVAIHVHMLRGRRYSHVAAARSSFKERQGLPRIRAQGALIRVHISQDHHCMHLQRALKSARPCLVISGITHLYTQEPSAPTKCASAALPPDFPFSSTTSHTPPMGQLSSVWGMLVGPCTKENQAA